MANQRRPGPAGKIVTGEIAEPSSESPASAPREAKEILRKKLTVLECRAKKAARGYWKWRSRYEVIHFLLAIPATVLAAVAGATALAGSSFNVVVGYCALGASALTGIQTIVRPDRRAKFNQTQQFALTQLADEAATSRDLALERLSIEQAQAEFVKLQSKYHELLSRSPE